MRLISHRGSCVRAIENTREAFEEALAKGFRSFETDLQLTKDGDIVLCHDDDLRRVAGRNERVDALSRSELENITLLDGSSCLWFLDELLQDFSQYTWTFDIKPTHASSVVEILASKIRERKMQAFIEDQVRFLVWEPEHEEIVRLFFPRAKFYARMSECRRAGLALVAGMPWLAGIKPHKIYSLPPRYLGLSFFDSSFVDAYHRRGAQVLAFLPESKEDYRRAISCGFDEMLVDDLYEEAIYREVLCPQPKTEVNN